MVLRYLDNEAVTARRARIFSGAVIHSKSREELELLFNTVLGVAATGRISFLRQITVDDALKQPGFTNAEIIKLSPSAFLFPGLIDTHLHAPQWPNLALGMDCTLKEWIEEYTDPVEASYQDVEKAKRVYSDVVRTTLRLGSTTVAYNASFHEEAATVLAKTCLAAGQRAIIGKMCVTLGSTRGNIESSIETSLEGSERTIRMVERLDNGRDLIKSSVMPRGGPYCPPSLMVGLGQQSEAHNAFCQLHMCETPDDIKRTLELHKGHSCYSDMYKAHGLFHSRTIAAHCIHLAPQDIANLRDCRAGVAHCPNSNTCLRDGICRVRDLLDAGIKVGLGTDCSAGYMPSIHEAMRSAANVSRQLAYQEDDARYVLKLRELVFLATLGGADVLGLKDEIGNFAVGKRFDALLIDAKDVISVASDTWSSSTVSGIEAMLSKWIFLGDDRTIRKVWVDGILVSGRDSGITA